MLRLVQTITEFRMPRPILSEAQIHPAIRDKIALYHSEIVQTVQAACTAHAVVVVGMRQNPFPKRVRKALDAAGVSYHYIEYGSYLAAWKERLALKMWTGWPTIPMVFVKGTLVGGADDVAKLIASGELKTLLAA
jgi:monothiol glutaredoxin